MARKKDDYLDRVNQALLEEEEEEEETALPATAPANLRGRLRNADRTDVSPEELAGELDSPSVRKPLVVVLLLLLLGAVFVGLALWVKYTGGLPW